MIRKSTEKDRSEILHIHVAAFSEEQGPEIAGLVNEMFNDKTACPILSLVAEDNGKMVGHILFSKVHLSQAGKEVTAQILAPLAVLPESQNKGIGADLIAHGIQQLNDSGVDLLFALGHPGYYPRCGFTPAGVLGFEAPHPIPEEHTDAWMVQELKEGIIGSINGKVQYSDVLNEPQHWRE